MSNINTDNNSTQELANFAADQIANIGAAANATPENENELDTIVNRAAREIVDANEQAPRIIDAENWPIRFNLKAPIENTVSLNTSKIAAFTADQIVNAAIAPNATPENLADLDTAYNAAARDLTEVNQFDSAVNSAEAIETVERYLN